MFNHYTGIGARNPDLHLGLLLTSAPALKILPQIPVRLLRMFKGLWSVELSAPTRQPATRVDGLVATACTLQLVLGACLAVFVWRVSVRGNVASWRDRAMVVTMIFMALVATHAFDFLVVGCYVANRNPVDFYYERALIIFEDNSRLSRTYLSDIYVAELSRRQN
jgi:hypothetical protein